MDHPTTLTIQLPRARCIGSHQKTNDLAREAVSRKCLVFGGQVSRLSRHYNSSPDFIDEFVQQEM